MEENWHGILVQVYYIRLLYMDMWDYINTAFDSYPAEKRVIQKLISVGLSVKIIGDETKIFCDEIEVKPNSIARAYKVDRRVVVNMLARIIKDKKLYDFFYNLKPVSNFEGAGSKIGFGVIEIIPDDANKPGIISGVMSVLSSNGINVRQVITDDPEILDNPKAIIVTSIPVSGNILSNIKKVNGVKGVLLL